MFIENKRLLEYVIVNEKGAKKKIYFFLAPYLC